MGFYWKYTRSGMYSSTYISFIIDVLPSNLVKRDNKIIWRTSFEELSTFIILLQDVEVLNNPVVGITKAAYAQFVNQLGYKTSKEYEITGKSFYLSKATMGTHRGSPLPWGFINEGHNSMEMDVTNLKYSAFPNAIDGKIPYHGDDKLSYYRMHKSFEKIGYYWDYMPMHSCIITFINSMKAHNLLKTEDFIRSILTWEKF